MRTEQNDNDKAKKYFRDPAEILRGKNAVLRGSENDEGNALVEKLKAQTEENKESGNKSFLQDFFLPGAKDSREKERSINKESK